MVPLLLAASLTDVYSLFAFANHSDEDIRRERIPEWRIGEAATWAAAKGVDHIHFQRDVGRPSSTRIVTHHLCRDPECPGGC